MLQITRKSQLSFRWLFSLLPSVIHCSNDYSFCSIVTSLSLTNFIVCLYREDLPENNRFLPKYFSYKIVSHVPLGYRWNLPYSLIIQSKIVILTILRLFLQNLCIPCLPILQQNSWELPHLVVYFILCECTQYSTCNHLVLDKSFEGCSLVVPYNR